VPKAIEFSCSRHEVDEYDERWSEALIIVSDQLKPGGTRTSTPCPWCIDELLNDVQETHNTLDTIGIPRYSRGKSTLSLKNRIDILFESEEKISDLRTS